MDFVNEHGETCQEEWIRISAPMREHWRYARRKMLEQGTTALELERFMRPVRAARWHHFLYWIPVIRINAAEAEEWRRSIADRVQKEDV